MNDKLLDEYAKHLTLERGVSPNTSAAYLGDVRHFLKTIGDKDALKMTQRDLEGYLWDLRTKLAAVSLARKIRALRSFYRFQAAEERIAEDPTRRLRSPRLPERLPEVLNRPEATGVVRAAES
ncbi:MAG: site-specific integrase, partial [Elusimicrobia bacterium]|nr:site-specific integrase [Elusimicrobiota bacterium]